MGPDAKKALENITSILKETADRTETIEAIVSVLRDLSTPDAPAQPAGGDPAAAVEGLQIISHESTFITFDTAHTGQQRLTIQGPGFSVQGHIKNTDYEAIRDYWQEVVEG